MADRPSGREESEAERLDRNLSELLQELRVALPGVQVLFAFLLAVPFQQRFTEITQFQKWLYFAVLILTALSAALLISPSAYHRLTFRMQQKDELLIVANKFAIAGLGCLALAMSGAIMLVTDLLFTTVATVIATVCALSAFALLWYALPLQRRRISRSTRLPSQHSNAACRSVTRSLHRSMRAARSASRATVTSRCAMPMRFRWRSAPR